MGLNLVCDILNYFVYVSTLIGEFVAVNHVYCPYPILFMSFQSWVDLVIFDMLDFNVILGMMGLSPYHSILNNNVKIMNQLCLG